MRLFLAFHLGMVKNKELYSQLKELDSRAFPGCDYDFADNRDWWVMLNDKGKIIAYCGSWYQSDISMFCRAWVHPEHRGKGLQTKMIKHRLKTAKGYGCNVAITYTTKDNCPSANNLIKNGFRLYLPQYSYAGDGMIYFSKSLKG
jgi:GNAT superfamily N-acetyltransferase